MKVRFKRLVATLTIAAFFTQMGCYNTYFISKDELEKLESGVEVKEVVTVQGDCRNVSAATGSDLDGQKVAQADEAGEAAGEGGQETASDATSTGGEKPEAKAGCKAVPVSTANSIKVVTNSGEAFRVTPFNFMMSQKQLVSPEYDLLLSLKNVKGAKVREFSTLKTIGTIAGVSIVTIGTFVGIGLASPDPSL